MVVAAMPWQRTSGIPVGIEDGPPFPAELLDAWDVRVEARRFGILDTWKLALPAGHGGGRVRTKGRPELVELPDARGHALVYGAGADPAEVFRMLQQAPGGGAPLPSLLGSNDRADREVHEFIAVLCPAPLAVGVAGVAPWVEPVPARTRSVEVRPIGP